MYGLPYSMLCIASVCARCLFLIDFSAFPQPNPNPKRKGKRKAFLLDTSTYKVCVCLYEAKIKKNKKQKIKKRKGGAEESHASSLAERQRESSAKGIMMRREMINAIERVYAELEDRSWSGLIVEDLIRRYLYDKPSVVAIAITMAGFFHEEIFYKPTYKKIEATLPRAEQVYKYYKHHGKGILNFCTMEDIWEEGSYYALFNARCKIGRRMEMADDIINECFSINGSCNLYDAALEAEQYDCGAEFLRIISNGTFYNGQFLHGGCSGKPIPYAGSILTALKYLPVQVDYDLDDCPKFGQVYETRTEVRRFCDI